MKNRKASWSIKGASNLAKILASKASKELDKLIDTLLSGTIEEKKVEYHLQVVL